MSILHMVIGMAEIALAVLLWHRALPALMREGRWRAWKVWLLGMALGWFGYDQVSAWLFGTAISSMHGFGDACLLAYGIGRLTWIIRHTPPPHWSELL